MMYPTAHRLQTSLPDNLGQLDNVSNEALQGLLSVAENFLTENLTVLKEVAEICQ